MGPRILIVNVNWLGDVLFSTPAIRALRKKYPDAHIACLVPSRCEAVLSGNPYLNEVIVYEERIRILSIFKTIRTVLDLRKKRFHTAILFHRSKTKVFLMALAGIPERIGFGSSKRRVFLTRSFPVPSQKIHKTDYFLRLLDYLGVPADGRVADFFPKEDAAKKLNVLLGAGGIDPGEPYIVVHAGGNWDLKRWPAAYFVDWIRLFLREYSMRVVLCGTMSEASLLDEIAAHFNSKEVVSLCGKTDLDELALLLKNAKLFLSNDSGPIHLGASQRARLVGLFGPTSPEETGPILGAPGLILRKDTGCEIPCYYRSCNYRVCMEWLSPGEVFQAARSLL